MSFKTIYLILLAIALIIATPFLFLIFMQYSSRAAYVKANIRVDTTKIIGPIITNWKALAQGGEEPGVRMFANVIPQINELSPRYIRLDHLYDFYHVVNRENNNLTFKWDELDATLCDIFEAGAKPFLSLGYMPSVISVDGTPIGEPKNWDDWALVVQKTIERYSGKTTTLCQGKITGNQLVGIYYEVWNEPDLESFGKWSLYGGNKDYKTLYLYSSKGATAAQNVNEFYFGGPATTALYQSWIQGLINYVANNRLRLDFLSWHHYTTNPDDYLADMDKINGWLSQPGYSSYSNLPKIISEWGYDPSPNPLADTDGGAAYTITSIRNLINKHLEMAFSFEVKDGPKPSWGILSYNGDKKPRYHALKLLNNLQGRQLEVGGEGTFVRAIASYELGKVNVILVNYDPQQKNTEAVPITFVNLPQENYTMKLSYTNGTILTDQLTKQGGVLKPTILMKPNMVVAIELVPAP